MSIANSPTVAAPPSTEGAAQEALSTMAALSGQLTDYNIGSQIRTVTESMGLVIEQQGISAQATGLQVISYSAMSAFGIYPNAAVPSAVILQFSTAASAPPPASQQVFLAAGTLVQTAGGIQFSTTQAVTLLLGQTSITVPAAATVGGTAGNVGASQITQIISGLILPLVVTNPAAATGGANAETPAQALARLTAKIASLVGGTPVATANGLIGVQTPGTSETVVYSSCFEPWVAAGSGAGSGQAGFTMFVDNGMGTASSGLLAACAAALNGNAASGIPGLRPTGVPFGVSGVVPVAVNVSIAAGVNSLSTDAVVSGALSVAIPAYFSTLNFGNTIYNGAIAVAAGNAAIGVLNSLTVTLALSGTPSTFVASVTAQPFQRIVLNSLTMTLN